MPISQIITDFNDYLFIVKLLQVMKTDGQKCIGIVSK